jgi:hypothetical protein
MNCLSRLALAAVLASAASSSQALAAPAEPAAKVAPPNATTPADPADTPILINPERLGSQEAEKIATAEPLSRFLWFNIGYYGAHHSNAPCGSFSTCSGIDHAVGLNIGAAFAVARLGEGFHFSVFANFAGAFGDLDYYPLTVGAGFAYDRLPLHLFGGAGFTVAPHTTGYTADESNNVAVGADVFLMALYPLPDVARHFGVQSQLQFNFLSQGFFIWSLSLGFAYSF